MLCAQLGDGLNPTGRTIPPYGLVLDSVSAISAGSGHTCAVMIGGGVRCWGQNIQGQASGKQMLRIDRD